ncbi:hypothetical protein FA13DRAFT_1728708, partial [Coprinellus micaceus]
MLPPHYNSLLAQARALNRQGSRWMWISVTVMRLMTGLEVKVFSECLAGINPSLRHTHSNLWLGTVGFNPLSAL